MKCIVCQKEYDDDLHSECPNCGAPPIVFVGDISESDPNVQALIEQYRAKMLRPTSFFLQIYTWKRGFDNTIVADKKLFLEFRKSDVPGEICWLDRSFARVIQNPLELKLGVGYSNNSQREFTVSMPVPKEVDYWRIGASFYGDFEMKLHIGSGNEITESEMIVLK